MLRSQSINNLNTQKTSSGFLKSLRSKKSENELSRTNLRSSISQRPLSISLSSFNLNNILSLAKFIQVEESTNNNNNDDDNDNDKENNVRRLKSRSSVPILSSRQNNNGNLVNKRHSTIFQVSPNNNNNNSSPQNTIQSQIDSIFDESDVIYVDSSEEDIMSNSSTINPNDSINKMHRTINSHNLSDFINQVHDDIQKQNQDNNTTNTSDIDHGKINFDFKQSSELKDLELLNKSLENKSNEFLSKFSILENFIIMSINNHNPNSNSIKNSNHILDDDFLEALKLDDYIEDDLVFSI